MTHSSTTMPDEHTPQKATPEALLALLRARRSCRHYDPERPVPRGLIDTCVEAARLAPSACNRQPWRFVVADDPAMVARLRTEGKRLGIPHPWWSQVPVFIAVCVQRQVLTHRIAPMVTGIQYDLIDLGIAGEHLVLAATALGLGTCWIGWFDEGAVRRLMGLPKGLRVAALITLGWPDDTPPAGPTSRLALEDIRRWNIWG